MTKSLDHILIKLNNNLIKNEYKNIINYLKENNIKERIRIRIIERYKLPENLILYFLMGILPIWAAIYDYTTYIPIYYAIYAIELGYEILMFRRATAYYSPLTRSIYFKKKSLEEMINNLSNNFYSNNMKIKEGNIVAFKFTGDRIVYYPIYADKNKDNIEEIISKVVIDAIGAHEISHKIIGRSDIKASTLGYLIYFDINKLYKYEKAKEIVRKNIENCVEYIKNNEEYNPYSIGECYANITLYKNNFSIDIKKEIERLKHMKDKDIIGEIKNYVLNYSN
jgi:hypothetical protein